jgi:hypothetical protein
MKTLSKIQLIAAGAIAFLLLGSAVSYAKINLDENNNKPENKVVSGPIHPEKPISSPEKPQHPEKPISPPGKNK